ncbi:sialate O-acetylesterase [Bremerella sp. T1]|uniref:sialate O-acetylesterase n=1 Tax=Bremerella sp. TYQ1 TaxID=3119568 RepID=UPI001CCDCBBF|nr:sialate O-acetylesterase [Bremerella volcania]UBM38273.1 sialate O-acetylesterase [Bremerella volcania]
MNSRWINSGMLATLLTVAMVGSLQAEVKLPALFTDHMVLQRDMPIFIWGSADKGSEVTVGLGDQKTTVTANDNGKWKAELKPLPAGGPHQVTVRSGDSEKIIKDVLVGEVWVCSGQSNMQWPVDAANDPDLEKLTANFPQIRLITVPQVGVQEPQDDFKGEWHLCTPDSVGGFSAVGYFFGRQLHQTLNVPVGLIDNAWGGSSAEAWVERDLLKSSGKFDELLARWEKTEATYDHEKAVAQYKENLAAWKEKAAKAKADGKPQPGGQPRAPRNPLTGQHRPANLYNGVLNPIIGYSVRGIIWYQGESNAGRAYQYRDLFPLMIQNWRDKWGQGDIPFYWVQLADFLQERDQPGDSAWAELREAQTMTLDKLPNTGQAVIIDLGEAEDIHPKNKQDVAKRLARLALANEYGYDIVAQSPRYKSMKVDKDAIALEFDTFGSQLDSFDTKALQGFTIAGEDKKFVHAKASIVGGNQVRVSSPEVKEPVAVRYAWGDNPVANLQNQQGLPATPFRTDEWDGVTKNAK